MYHAWVTDDAGVFFKINFFIEFIQCHTVWFKIRTDVLWFKSYMYELFDFNGRTDIRTNTVVILRTCGSCNTVLNAVYLSVCCYIY